MPSEIVFAGGGLDSCTVIAGTPTEITTAGWYDATYCDSALNIPAGAVAAFYPMATTGARTTFVDGEVCWVHWEQRGQFTGTANGVYHYLYDSAGFPWLRIQCAAAVNTFILYYNSGTGASPVWTALTGSTPIGLTSLNELDLKLAINSAGQHTAELFIARTSVLSGNFTQGGLTNIASFRAGSPSGNVGISQVAMRRDQSTVGMKVAYKRPTATGNANAWTGAYTDIDEVINSDTDTISTAVAGNDYTFNVADVTVPANYAIGSVFNFARAKNDGVAPNNVKSLCRSGGTTYASTNNLVGMGTGFSGVGMRYDTDPSTSAAWLQAGFNSAEWGLRSAT